MIIQPGLSSLTWSSISVQLYVDRCQLYLNHLKGTLKQICDTKKHRIDDFLKKIAKADLLTFPDDFSNLGEEKFSSTVIVWSLKEFKRNIRKVCQSQAKNIDNWLAIAEQGVKELIEIIRIKSFENYESSIQLYKKKSQEDTTSIANMFISTTSIDDDLIGGDKQESQQKNRFK